MPPRGKRSRRSTHPEAFKYLRAATDFALKATKIGPGDRPKHGLHGGARKKMQIVIV